VNAVPHFSDKLDCDALPVVSIPDWHSQRNFNHLRGWWGGGEPLPRFGLSLAFEPHELDDCVLESRESITGCLLDALLVRRPIRDEIGPPPKKKPQQKLERRECPVQRRRDVAHRQRVRSNEYLPEEQVGGPK
jgi:hypothetical protein